MHVKAETQILQEMPCSPASLLGPAARAPCWPEQKFLYKGLETEVTQERFLQPERPAAQSCISDECTQINTQL